MSKDTPRFGTSKNGNVPPEIGSLSEEFKKCADVVRGMTDEDKAPRDALVRGVKAELIDAFREFIDTHGVPFDLELDKEKQAIFNAAFKGHTQSLENWTGDKITLWTKARVSEPISSSLASYEEFHVENVLWVNRTLDCGFCLQYPKSKESVFEEAFGFKA